MTSRCRSDLIFGLFLKDGFSIETLIFSSISFVSRKFSRIRLEGATPGPYFVMLEALTDLTNVTLSVSVTPTSSLIDDDDFGRIEDNHISYDAVP